MTETLMSYILYVISLILMLFVHFTISAMVSDIKHPLFRSFKEWVLGDSDGMFWLWNNHRFLIYYIFRGAIIGIALSNVGQFMADDIFTRNPFIQYAQPMFWTCIAYIIYDYKRLWDLFEKKSLS